jgi:DNA-directed RNA polymerase subunit RPC12/RpoP
MSTGESVRIKDRPLRCTHCGHGRFAHRSAQLNTAFMEFFDLAWLNKTADIYVCAQCGFLHWFLDPQVEQPIRAPQLDPGDQLEEPIPAPEPDTGDELEEPTECLECHQTIPAGTAKCPSCGWSYK